MLDAQLDDGESNDRRLADEARRLCERYVDEIVLAFDLCPWAAPALRAGQVQITVITEHLRSPEEFAASATVAAQRLVEASASDENELLLLVFPRCRLPRLQFDVFLREVRARLTSSYPTASEVPYALAAFHPDAPADDSTPERLIPYLRRSPDPLLQAVRTRSLARLEEAHGSGTEFVGPAELLAIVRGAPPPEPLRLRIARRNLATFEEAGRAAFERVFDALRLARRRAYRELAPELLDDDVAP